MRQNSATSLSSAPTSTRVTSSCTVAGRAWHGPSVAAAHTSSDVGAHPKKCGRAHLVSPPPPFLCLSMAVTTLAVVDHSLRCRCDRGLQSDRKRLANAHERCTERLGGSASGLNFIRAEPTDLGPHAISESFVNVNAKAKRRQHECTASEAGKVHG